MADYIVVHTGAGPDTPCPEEEKVFAEHPEIEFRKLGKCATTEAVLEAVRDADVAMVFGEFFDRAVFEGAPKLKGVLRSGVGVDTLDLDAATENGVMIGHYPDFCIPEVANHALAHLLCCAKKMVMLDRSFRAKGFAAAKSLTKPMGCIHGETVGLLAFGNIARDMAKRCQCLGMTVVAYDPFVDQSVFDEMGVESVSLEELAARSDYVSCHVPLNAHTEGMVNAAFFAKMKSNAYFINTSRGPVVNEPDLIAALQSGQIAGAGLDVFGQEPPPADNPLLAMDNVVLTPHTASYADQTMLVRNRRMALDAVRICHGGEPEFVANRAVLENRRK